MLQLSLNMNNAKKTFISGLNHDASFFAHTREDNLDALNARVITSAEGKAGSLSNIEGNRKINNLLAEKDSRVIGSFEDPITNDVYYFTVSSASSSPSKIYVYKNSANAIYLVLSDTDLEDDAKLGFTSSKLITGIYFLDGLLYWTGSVNKEPYRINVDRGIKLHHSSYSTTESAYAKPIPKSVVTLIRKPPMLPPIIEAQEDSSRDTSFLKPQAHTFAFRYKYKDGETSVFSPSSEYYPHQDMDHEEHKKTRKIKITFPSYEKIEQDVKKIQIAVKFDNDTSFFIIKDFDKESEFTTHNSGATTPLVFNYYNDTLGIAVDDSNSVKLYDTVPAEAEALTIARNRLFLGNIKEGLENATKPTTSHLKLDLVTSSIPDTTTLLSSDRTRGGIVGFASASAFQVGIAFYDFAGRSGGVLTDDSFVVITPERELNMTTYSESIKWELLSGSNAIIPTWATHYSIVRTKNLTKDFTVGNLSDKIRYWTYDSAKNFTVFAELKDDDGLFYDSPKFSDNELSVFKSSYEGIAIGLGDLTSYKLGYSYQEGDRIKLITATSVFDFAITGKVGKFITCNLVNLNSDAYLNSGNLAALDNIIVYEIYSPHKKQPNEFFYETKHRYEILNPGESDRNFETTEGDISGGVYLKKRTADTSFEESHSVSHTDDNGNDHENPIVGKTDYIEFPVHYGTGLNDLSVADYTSYTNAGDLRYEIIIDATGSPDTFKWRSDVNASYTSGVAITGNNQTLTNGVTIKFAATTGHTVGDRWMVSAKSSNGTSADRDLSDEGRTAYGFFEGVPNDVIPVGSEVKFTIKETGQKERDVDVTVEASEITQTYANLEELVREKNVGFGNYGSHEIFFRRGLLNPTANGGKSQIKILGNASDSVTVTAPSLSDGTTVHMIVLSEGRQNSAEINKRSFIECTITINYPDEHGYNAEAMNPSDDYFLKWTQITGRPNLVIEDPKEVVKKTSITFSETKIPGSNINGLSKFSALDETELDEVTGPLRKLALTSKTQSTGTVLLGLSENETTSIYLGEQQLQGASSGNEFLSVSSSVVGTKNTLQGSYGCINPESVVVNEGNAYWFDAKNSTVVKYTSNGLVPIGDAGMKTFFNKKGPIAMSGQNVYGTYDIFNNEYIITVPDSGAVTVVLQDGATYETNPTITHTVSANNLLSGTIPVYIGGDWNMSVDVAFSNGVGTMTFNNPYRFSFPDPTVIAPSGSTITAVNASSGGFSVTTESGVAYHNTGSGSLTISNVMDNVTNITLALTRNDGAMSSGTVTVRNQYKYWNTGGYTTSTGPYDTPLRVTGATPGNEDSNSGVSLYEYKYNQAVSSGSATIPCTSSVAWKTGSTSSNTGFYYNDHTTAGALTQIPSSNISVTGATAIGSLGYQAGSFNVVISGIDSPITYIYMNSRPLGNPSVNTDLPSVIAATGFIMNGDFVSLGDGAFTAKGFVYSSSVSVPEIGVSNVTNQTVAGSSTGKYAHTLTGLSSATTYYYRAYVTTNVGTVYGSVQTATTLNPAINTPTVVTTAATNVANSTATLNGNITANGGGTITENGFVYSRTAVNNNPVIDGTGVTKVVTTTASSFTHYMSANITGLNTQTGYKFKAYATNAAGTAYGANTTLTTTSQGATLKNLLTNNTSSIPGAGGYVSLQVHKEGTGLTLSGSLEITVYDGFSVLDLGINADTTFNISMGATQTNQTIQVLIPDYSAPTSQTRNLTFKITEITGMTLNTGSLPVTASAQTSQPGSGTLQ